MRRTIVLLATITLTLLVASGVALAVTKIGGPGPDTLKGTNGAENLLGNGANDVLFALGGRDNLLGGEGKDWALGGNERRPFGGDKILLGGPGNDGVVGGIGSDKLLGGSGNDFLLGDNGSDSAVVGGKGKDLVEGGRGADRIVGAEGTDILIEGALDNPSEDDLLGGEGDDIFVADNVPATKDIVSCGRGFDRALVDRKDAVAPDCEKVRVVRGSVEEVMAQETAFFENVPPSVTQFFGTWETFFSTFFEEQLAPDPTVGG